MLDPVAELAEDVLGDVGRALGDEVDAHALGADEADDLLDLGGQGLGGVLEEHMGLVEEEDELGKVHVADLREGAVQLGQQPEEEGRIELGLEHELVRGQDVHHALPALALEEVEDVEGRTAEEQVGALVLEAQEGALDGADGGRGHIAVLGGEFRRVLAHEIEHGAEVLQVIEQEAVVVGDLEDDVQDAGLRLVQLHQAAQQVRAHVGDGRAHGMALLAIDVEEADGAALELRVLDAELRQALLDETGKLARLADAGEVALHVGHEAGHAGLAEGFGQHLQGDGLAGTGGAGDEAVAVRHLSDDGDGAVCGVGYVQPAFFIKHVYLFLRYFQR